MVYGKSEVLYQEGQIALLALGSMVKTGELVREMLHEKGYRCTLVNARFAKPLDEEMILGLTKGHKLLVTLEENVASGGFGERVTEVLNRNFARIHVVNVSIPDAYVEHGNVEILRRVTGIDEATVVERVLEEYSRCCKSDIG